jgi:hypothetical protein
MKYLKTFESVSTIPQFKVGDFVYSDNTMNSMFLEKDVRYEIESVIPKTQWTTFVYKLKEIPNEAFFEYRFISEEEYVLQHSIKKYNL